MSAASKGLLPVLSLRKQLATHAFFIAHGSKASVL